MRNSSYLASWSPETRCRTPKFSDLDEFSFDSDNIQDIAYSYLTACNHSTIQSDLSTLMYFNLQSPPSDPTSLSSRSVLLDTVSTPHSPATYRTLLYPVKTLPSPSEQVSTFAAKRKYKPVALKVRPVLADLPEKYRITQHIIGDPLTSLPTLTPTPPPFISHKPWLLRNMPIPPGIYDEVCRIIRAKIDAGVYKRSNSSYRSRWFTVVKKDRTNLRIVHSLEPLNAVTI